MPSTKHGALFATTALVLGCAAVPSSASAFSLSDLWSSLGHLPSQASSAAAPVTDPVTDTVTDVTDTVGDTVTDVTDTVTDVLDPATDGCVAQDARPAFAQWGDDAEYALAPGGDLESADGWTLTGGARIATGNETLGVQPGSRSLRLPLGATATSPAFCVDESHPYFRFVSKPDSALAGYQAVVIYRDAAGTATSAQFTASSEQSWGPGSWAPSAVNPLATKIPLLLGGRTASVQIKFVATGNPVAGTNWWGKLAAGTVGAVRIDSLMVDPYRRG